VTRWVPAPAARIRGRFSAQDVDTFEPTADRLLLAKSFARLHLDDREAWNAWNVRHGALDPYDLFDGDGEPAVDGALAEDRPEDAFAESRDDWLAEQANVRWHLSLLERLSDARETRAWGPAWGAFVLDAGTFDNVLVGGDHAGARVWPDESLELVERYPHAHARYGDAATQRFVREEAARRPRILVRPAGWHLWFGPRVGRSGDLDPLPDVAGLGGTWASMLEVERRLIEPYVAAAVERRFRIKLVTGGDRGIVFMPREDRLWVSILAPIHLQLFEALRRITEGEPGAAICHECGRGGRGGYGSPSHRTRQRMERLVSGSRWTDSGHVFTTLQGTPYHAATITRAFQAALTRAGLPPCRFHDLRHAAATFLLAQGMTFEDVKNLLGHSSITLTSNTYGHVLEQRQRQVARAMDAVLGG
jgi:hypothetical protein